MTNPNTTLSLVKPDDATPSAVGLAVVLLRQRFVMARIVIIAILIGVTVALLQERTYTAESIVIPQGRASITPMSGLAAQLGLAVPSSDPASNPSFYADLLKSRVILGAAVDSFAPALTRAFDLRAEADTARRRDQLERELSRHVAASVDMRTGVVKLAVTTTDATLSQRVNAQLLVSLNQFNGHNRQSQAGAERAFVERRLAEVRDDLRVAEDRVIDFLRSNRTYHSAPNLQFANDRLARQVTTQQQLATLLEQNYERARMDEVRDTPVLTVIQPPSVPVRTDPRGLGQTLAFAFVVGLLLAIGVAYGRTLFHGGDAPAVAELDRLLAACRRDWRHPLLTLRNIARGRAEPQGE
jgi:uncharacterized protein involved in exopolysaccharide biosynthesis